MTPTRKYFAQGMQKSIFALLLYLYNQLLPVGSTWLQVVPSSENCINFLGVYLLSFIGGIFDPLLYPSSETSELLSLWLVGLLALFALSAVVGNESRYEFIPAAFLYELVGNENWL